MESRGYTDRAVADKALPVPTKPVVYKTFRPKPKGLNWDEHRNPEDAEREFQANLKRRMAEEEARRRRKPRTREESWFPPKVMTLEDRVNILHDYIEEQLTIAQIAKNRHISNRRIANLLKEEGVQLRGTRSGNYKKVELPAFKICTGCGSEFTRRTDERPDHYKARKTCSWECRSASISESMKARRNK